MRLTVQQAELDDINGCLNEFVVYMQHDTCQQIHPTQNYHLPKYLIRKCLLFVTAPRGFQYENKTSGFGHIVSKHIAVDFHARDN